MSLHRLSVKNTIFIKIPWGEDPLRYLEKLDLDAGFFIGIGGLDYAKIGIFDGRQYRVVEVTPLPNYILEVLSITGNIIRGEDGKLHPHAHIVLSRSHGEVYGGHLLAARTNPFIELFLIELEPTGEFVKEFRHRWSVGRT